MWPNPHFLQIWPHLLKKSLMENFIFCVVFGLPICFHYNSYQVRKNFLLSTRYSLRFAGCSLIFTLFSFFFMRKFAIFYLFLVTFTCYSLLFSRRLLFSLLFSRYLLSVSGNTLLVTRYLIFVTRVFLITFYDKAIFKKWLAASFE